MSSTSNFQLPTSKASEPGRRRLWELGVGGWELPGSISMDRRQFLEAALVAVASSRSWAVSGAPAQGGVQGANNRIRVAIIGTGSRGNQVMQSWLSHKDSVFTAICDVAKDRLDNTASKLASAGQKVDTYEDYRKILE